MLLWLLCFEIMLVVSNFDVIVVDDDDIVHHQIRCLCLCCCSSFISILLILYLLFARLSILCCCCLNYRVLLLLLLFENCWCVNCDYIITEVCICINVVTESTDGYKLYAHLLRIRWVMTGVLMSLAIREWVFMTGVNHDSVCHTLPTSDLGTCIKPMLKLILDCRK